MSNHLRNIRALFENAKSFKVSRKVDTYEYESLEKMILDDNVRYSEVIELFTDKIIESGFIKEILEVKNLTSQGIQKHD